jgi:ribosomal protein L11 methyltransferase
MACLAGHCFLNASMSNSIEIVISVDNEELREILIAELAHLNFSGFEEEEAGIKAYIFEEEFDEESLNELCERYNLSYSKSIIQPKNWNELWERDFKPVNVNNFCLIRADFHCSHPSVKHEVVIMPKMSFGTGHHATTYLMVEQMQHIDFQDKRVADFGTGTGVLAVLAEKLGSAHIKAIDNDDWSINNAKENFDKNGCSRIELQQKDSFDETASFDVILANINKHVILANLPGLVFALNSSGTLLLSGLQKADESEILAHCSRYNLVAKTITDKDQWISIRLHFNENKPRLEVSF